MRATPTTDSIKTDWEEGRAHEVAFWADVIDGKGKPGRYHAELLKRADPNREFPKWLGSYLSTSKLEDARILDIGAGPISSLGWILGGVRLNIVAIDALANRYNDMLKASAITPPVKTQQWEGECLRDQFSDDSFDLIYCRNALDHCYDPVKIIQNAIHLLKPSAKMIVCSNLNEAENAKYAGFHQWNIDMRDEKVIIWRPGVEQILEELIEDIGEVSVIDCSRETKWLRFYVEKL